MRPAGARSQTVAWRQLDVADHEQVTATMQALVAEHGAPEVLINCAGRAYPRRFEDITYAQFAETMLVNLHGCWNTVQALLPHMKAKGRGYIVNTSSIAGLIGVFGYTDYCASKFALVGFSEALRSELKPHGITVSVLCPPDTDTPGFATENLTKPEETRAISATAKVLPPAAIADALLRGMAPRHVSHHPRPRRSAGRPGQAFGSRRRALGDGPYRRESGAAARQHRGECSRAGLSASSSGVARRRLYRS